MHDAPPRRALSLPPPACDRAALRRRRRRSDSGSQEDETHRTLNPSLGCDRLTPVKVAYKTTKGVVKGTAAVVGAVIPDGDDDTDSAKKD